MSDEERKIIISKVSEYRQNESGEYDACTGFSGESLDYLCNTHSGGGSSGQYWHFLFCRVFLPYSRWLWWWLESRFWWLRRNLKIRCNTDNANRQAETDQTVIIEDAQIIEETETHRDPHKK
jgi:hypothetical protein